MMFLIKDGKGLENLINAAEKYEFLGISLSKYRVGGGKGFSIHYKNSKKERLFVKKGKENVSFSTKDFQIFLPLGEDSPHGFDYEFRIEYRNKHNQRIHKNYPQFGNAEITSFVGIINKKRMDINFLGKIELEKDGEIDQSRNYWKIKK